MSDLDESWSEELAKNEKSFNVKEITLETESKKQPTARAMKKSVSIPIEEKTKKMSSYDDWELSPGGRDLAKHLGMLSSYVWQLVDISHSNTMLSHVSCFRCIAH